MLHGKPATILCPLPVGASRRGLGSRSAAGERVVLTPLCEWELGEGAECCWRGRFWMVAHGLGHCGSGWFSGQVRCVSCWLSRALGCMIHGSSRGHWHYNADGGQSESPGSAWSRCYNSLEGLNDWGYSVGGTGASQSPSVEAVLQLIYEPLGLSPRA